MSSKVNRRRFLQSTPIAAVALPATAASGEEQRDPSPSSDRLFRVGALNVSIYSHLEAVWAPLLNPRPDKQEIPFTGMRITHCWEIDRSKAESFGKTFGCEVVEEFDDMLGKVDGIISGGYYNHPWNHILHEPYLEAGLPNLVNRPLSNSIEKAAKIVELAKKHQAPLLVPSSHEHNDAISRAKAWAEGKEIICYNVTNSFDDYPTHGIHAVYMACRAIAEAGNPVVSVAYQAESWHRPPGVVILEHVDAKGRKFLGTLHQASGSWGTMRIHTQDEYGGKGFDIHVGTGYPYNKTEIWAPTLWAFQKMALFGEMPQTFEQIGHKHRVFMAGWKSVLDNEGKPITLDEVPEEWESPVALPTHPEDNTVALFEKKFGKARRMD